MVGAQRHVDELDGVRIARAAAAREALDLERDFPMLGDRPLAVERADVAPDHHPYDVVDSGFGNSPRADKMAVAQHGVAVADPENFLQPVGDEDDRKALGLQRCG